jgi:hypothetical protein
MLLLTGAGPALAQNPPEKVAPGTISTAGGEGFPALDPIDGSLWYSTHDEKWGSHTIVRAPALGNGWGAPETLSFSGVYENRAPRPTPDGRRIVFSSNRPRPGETGADDWNLWVVTRAAGGGWTNPTPLPAPVSTDAQEFHASPARDGSLWFASNRPGGAGRSDLYAARPDGEGWAVEPVGGALATPNSEPDVWIDPDERFAIVVITDREDGYGGDDLYLTIPEEDGWSRPVNLGEGVNSKAYEYGPFVSVDGQWLWFTSHRDGSGDLYRIRVSDVPALRVIGPAR